MRVVRSGERRSLSRSATRALDVQTEREIVETIRSLAGKKTILLVAHRETTLAASNRILRLSGGKITSHVHTPSSSREEWTP